MGDNNREWKYDAFISYRHLEPDAFVAGSLHKILESYKVPGNLLKSNGDKLKRTKINKVFRDAEELPLTSNLNDTIIEALENSEYLIAICSPKFGESLWCKKEVETFIKLRGKENVLTVLVDGEPSESFPETLLYREVEVKQEDGTIKVEKEPIEPLAANARGTNNKERLKILKTEALRLMAPMFGCSFDDLKQRHREQKMKRTIRIVGGVAAVCLAFGIVSTTMALKISSQNAQITSQNAQIIEQSEQIEQQYKEALLSNANSVGDYARNLYESGDRIGALENAYAVFPKEESDNPYVEKVEYVLSDALSLYENGRYLKPDRLIECESVVENVILSAEGNKLVTIDADGITDVWDTNNGEKIASLQLEKSYNQDKQVAFKDEDTILYVKEDQLYEYSITDATENVLVDASALGKLNEVLYSTDKDRILLSGYDGVCLYDGDGELISKVDYEDSLFTELFGDNAWMISCIKNSGLVKGRDDYYALIFSAGVNDKELLCLYDTVTGKRIGHAEYDDVSVGSIKCYGDSLYVATNGTLDENARFDTDKFISFLTMYDIKSDGIERIWEKTFYATYIYDVAVSLGGKGEKVACQFYDRISVLNKNDGSVKCQMDADSGILKLYGYLNSDYFSIVTRDGKWLSVSDENQMLYDGDFWKSNSSNIKEFATAGCSVSVPFYSNIVTLYRFALSEGAKETDVERVYNVEEIRPESDLVEQLELIGIKGSFVNNIYYDEAHNLMGVTYKDRSVDIIKLDENKVPKEKVSTISKVFDTYVNNMSISANGDYMIMSGSQGAYLFRVDSIDFANTFPGAENIVAKINGFTDVDYDKGCVYVADYDSHYEIPFYDVQTIGKLAADELNNEK